MSEIRNMWGADYGCIRSYLSKNKYTTEGYYNAVQNIPHFYKGIHPARVSLEAIKYINNKIEQKFDRFFEDPGYFIEEITVFAFGFC